MKTRSSQRGAAALVVAMVLLFGMTLVAFFANRTMIFEQRTSANQVRYTKAFEMADAGIEWATARLNENLKLAANSCALASGATLVSFRDRYMPSFSADATHPTGWFSPVSTAYPGCQIDPSNGTFSCGCPAAGAATLASTDQPRFRVQFNAVTAGVNNPTTDYTAVEIIARGCTSSDPCDPTQAVSASTDSSAIARVIVKIRPALPRQTGAGMVSGSTTVAGGSINVVNTDTKSNGITINTGSTVDLNGSGTTVQTLPGTSPTASILDNDPSLLKLTNADSTGELFFTSFFGEGFTDYRTNLLTKVITNTGVSNYANRTCSSDTDCARAVSYWVDRGATQFWLAAATPGGPGVQFSNSNLPSIGTLGTASKPILLATDGQMIFSGGMTAYGVFYAATATAQDDATLGAGNATIIGSLVSRGDFNRTGSGNLSIIYNGNLFGPTGPLTGILVPLPGSWRDKATPY